MKVKELIKELEQFNKNMEAVIYADHGQTHFKAQNVGIEKVESLDKWMMEHAYDDDPDAVKVVVIGG